MRKFLPNFLTTTLFDLHSTEVVFCECFFFSFNCDIFEGKLIDNKVTFCTAHNCENEGN